MIRQLTMRTWAMMTIGVSLLTTACSDDVVVRNRIPSDQLLWALVNDVRAAMMAVGDTVKITAAPKNVSGNTLSVNVPVKYRSDDPRKVRVDSLTGEMIAREAVSSVFIISTLTVDGVTSSDTTKVAVTDARKPLKTLQLIQLTGDTVDMGASMPVMISATDSSNIPVFSVPVAFSSTDMSLGFPFMGGILITFVKPGRVGIIGETLNYGVPIADTAYYTIGYPRTSTVIISNTTLETSAVVGVGATISFSNQGGIGKALTIEVLNDLHNVEGTVNGYVDLAINEVRVVKFMAPGVYRWRNTQGLHKGTITVLENP